MLSSCNKGIKSYKTGEIREATIFDHFPKMLVTWLFQISILSGSSIQKETLT